MIALLETSTYKLEHESINWNIILSSIVWKYQMKHDCKN